MKEKKQNKSKKRANKKQTAISDRRIAVMISLVAVGIAVVAVLASVLGGSGVSREWLFDEELEVANGIDVSQHNGEIVWAEVAEEKDFAIIRAGFRGYESGELGEDSRFAENAKAANEAGIPIGIYFYSQATTQKEAREEAEFVLKLIKDFDVALPIFIDYEYAQSADGQHIGRLSEAKLSSAQAADVINAFCRKIISHGFKAGVYASSSVLNMDIKTSDLDKDIYIWAADYNSSVKYLGSYDLWQYTKKGDCGGVSSKYTDLNYWYHR